MGKLEYNEEAAQRLLGVYITPDIVAQRNEFLKEINFKEGECVLDVGSGPGFLAQLIAKKVGSTGFVSGVDVSEFLLNIAITQNKEIPNIKFEYGDAINLPYADENFNSLVCTQVLEYVDDVDKALIEFERVLKKDGKIALLDTDWDSIVWHSSNNRRMNRMLNIWNEHATDPFLPRTLSRRMERVGFQIELQKIIPIYNPIFKTDTYSNRMIDLIAHFVVEHGNVDKVEAETWAHELREDGKRGEYFFSLNRYLFLAKKM